MLDAEALLSLRTGGLIEKTSFTVPWREHVWELDVFSGANAGLVIAEIELRHELERFDRPPWLGGRSHRAVAILQRIIGPAAIRAMGNTESQQPSADEALALGAHQGQLLASVLHAPCGTWSRKPTTDLI